MPHQIQLLLTFSLSDCSIFQFREVTEEEVDKVLSPYALKLKL